MNQDNFENILWYENRVARSGSLKTDDTTLFDAFHVEQVRRFHRTLPGYRPTPLIPLPRLSRRLGVMNIRIKDESQRLGLKAFKVLGASYGICRALAERLNMPPEMLNFDAFVKPEVKKMTNDMTVVTATDGNHGRAVAWVAEQLGCRSVVFMPKGSSQVRLENIRRHGALASIIEGNYDDAVRMAEKEARQNGWLLVQDTTRPGYEKIPTWIMQGYASMVDEALEQMGGRVPSHVLVQCGVGSFASSIQAYLVQRFGDARPVLTVVEPTRAGCFYQSVTSEGRNAVVVKGEMNTIMAGLACGEPNPLAWNILRDFADAFVMCPDQVTIQGMRLLGHPRPQDQRIVSGESGAVTLGLVNEILSNPACEGLKRVLAMDETSDILLFSTEGDTDPEIYAMIVQGEIL